MSELSGKETESKNEKKGGKRTVVIVAVVILALVATVVVLAVKLLGTKEERKEKRGVITADNVEEVVGDWMNDTPGDEVPKYYTVVQNTEWNFENGDAVSSDAYVENDKDNETPVYFDVIVDESGETVYSSPILSLGAGIREIKLDTKLPKGDYVCTVVYHLIDKDENDLTTVNVGTTIHILN